MRKISLSVARPDLAKQFHPYKNVGVSPDLISYQRKAEVWWICEKGHEWQEKVSSRSRQKSVDCKICSSLACTHPQLTKELHPSLNNEIKAGNITAGSHLKLWWTCDKGHEYDAVVKNRVIGIGCPYCSGRKVLT
jgi:hypothetical protein